MIGGLGLVTRGIHMKHLSDEVLADYARGLLSDSAAQGFEDHLTACGECRETLEFLRSVNTAATVAEVPLDIVRNAKQISSRHRGERRVSLSRAVARLIFEGPHMQLADVRSTDSMRQAMYRWGDYCVDLRFENEPESARVALVGQIANERSPEVPVADVPVALVVRDKVVANTSCNSLGEFCIEFAPLPNMRLEFAVEGERIIEIPLKRMTTPL